MKKSNKDRKNREKLYSKLDIIKANVLTSFIHICFFNFNLKI